MANNNNIEEFIDLIIKQSGFDKMPADFLDEYKERLGMEAKKRLGLMAMKELDNKEIMEVNKLMENAEKQEEPDYAALNDYFAAHIDNFQEKMTIALEEFGREVIESAKKLAV